MAILANDFAARTDWRHDAARFHAQVAAKDANPGWSGTPHKTPYSFALGYAPGPWQLRFGYEKPADGRSKLATLFGGYDFGAFTLNAMVAGGTDHTDASVRTWALSSVVPAGTGQFRASFGHYKRADVVASQKLALGYHHFLSKRTDLNAVLTHLNNKNTSQDMLGGNGFLGGVAAAPGKDVNSLALSIRHRF